MAVVIADSLRSKDRGSHTSRLSILKGTGFSPYVRAAKMKRASAPEGMPVTLFYPL